MSTSLPVLLQRAGEVATIAFNRPEKLNALSSASIELLGRYLGELAGDQGVRSVVITGRGRAFVAGADLEEYASQSLPEFVAYQRASRELFEALECFPKPVVAAVNGYALGGGFELALCCDFIVASEAASFGLPEGLLGLCPGGGGTQRLVRAVGRYVASEVLLAARRLSAREAAELGLVALVCPAEELEERVLEKARATSRVAPLAAMAMKQLLREGPDASLGTALTLEQETLVRLFQSADAKEGVAAFAEKRAPAFRGS